MCFSVSDSGPAIAIQPPSPGNTGGGAGGASPGTAVLEIGPTDTSSTATKGSNQNSNKLITLSGVSQPTQLNVIYGQGTQNLVNQAAPSDPITTLAQELVSSKKKTVA